MVKDDFSMEKEKSDFEPKNQISAQKNTKITNFSIKTHKFYMRKGVKLSIFYKKNIFYSKKHNYLSVKQ